MDPLPERNILTSALVVEKPGSPFELQDVILGEVRKNEMLVEIKYAGLCHTDLVVQAGKFPLGSYPAILGHEGSGVIRRLGPGLENSSLKVGDRVILSFCSCLSCTACREGRKGACDHIAMTNFVGTRGGDGENEAAHMPNGVPIRSSFYGQSSFSKMSIVDARSVVKYDGPVEDLAFLAPLGCGYMTGAATVMHVLKPKPSNSIAVFGLGAVGLSAVMAAKSEGVKDIVAVDILPDRLKTAASLGATETVDSKSFESVEAAIRSVLPNGVDFIVDTTGLGTVISSGISVLAHGGTFAIVGTPHPEDVIKINAIDMLIHCKKIIGVTGGYCDPQEFLPRLIKLFKDGSFPIDGLYKTYSPEKIDDAINDMKSGKVIKPVIAW